MIALVLLPGDSWLYGLELPGDDPGPHADAIAELFRRYPEIALWSDPDRFGQRTLIVRLHRTEAQP